MTQRVELANKVEDAADLAVKNRELALGYVRQLLRKWGCHLPIEDMRSLADVAVCCASQTFKKDRNVQFGTYLYFFVVGTLKTHIREECRYAKIATAGYFGQDTRDACDSAGFRRSAWELDSPDYNQPFVKYEEKERDRFLQMAIMTLSTAERMVVERLFFGDGDANELAAKLGCSVRKVWRIRALLLRKLRGFLEENKDLIFHRLVTAEDSLCLSEKNLK